MKPTYSINFKLLRKWKGYTQQEFSEKVGIKRGTYAGYEEGRIEPPINTFYKICSLFEISMEKMLKEKIELIVNKTK